MNQISPSRPRKSEDGLGPSSDIGAKLRALYSSIQDEGIPERFLDLLDKLDEAERAGRPESRAQKSQVAADGE